MSLIILIVNNQSSLDPFSQFGEFEYNLNVLKEVTVTDSFMDLASDIRKCQDVVPYEHCSTQATLDTILRTCGCLPIHLRFRKLPEKVKMMPLCNKTQLECINNLDIDKSHCTVNCKGILISSLLKSTIQQDIFGTHFAEFQKNYSIYRGTPEFPQNLRGKINFSAQSNLILVSRIQGNVLHRVHQNIF